MSETPKILVVDDDARMREMLVEILAQDGFVVDSAEGADEARQALERGGVSLVIIDHRRTPRNGPDLLSELGARHPAPPTILMTTSTDLDSQSLTEYYGLAGFLRKPFRQVELQKLVSELLLL